MAKGSSDDSVLGKKPTGKNLNVLDDDSWNDMYTDKEPRDWAGYDRPAKRSHPMHPDDRPSTEYTDGDNDPGHDRHDESEDYKMPPELMDPPSS